MTAFRIHFAGPQVTVQDGGRQGYLRFGVTPAGPMDALAMASANHALGLPLGKPALEISMGGVDLSVEDEPLAVAIASDRFRVALNGKELPSSCLLTLQPGERLTVKTGERGAFAYLAFAADFAFADELGSYATHTRSFTGGFEGRGLTAGDALPLANVQPVAPSPASFTPPCFGAVDQPIRVMAGPQDDYFTPEEMQNFYEGDWWLSPKTDRMAFFLNGPTLTHKAGFDIVSDGIAFGAIQVPGDGHPIVLMADRQPTGGYPKIATIISADRGRLAQLRPGDHFHFAPVTHQQAVEARRKAYAAFDAPFALTPLTRGSLTSEDLLAVNLVSGVVSALDPQSE